MSLYISAMLWNYIQDNLVSLFLSRLNYTLMVGNFECLVYLETLLVGYLEISVLKVDFSGSVNKKG